MASRMDKYYEKDGYTRKRSIKNMDLYKRIYETGEYSNIEGIANIEKTNEVDISKIKELLKQRELEKTQNVLPIVKKVELKPVIEEEKEAKNYDINDMLDKAKEEQEDNKLRDTKFNILKDIDIEEVKEDSSERELKQLIHTLTSNDLVSQLKDEELSLDLLNDLKSDIGDIELKEEAKKQENTVLDNSFFTSSVNFDKEDFDDFADVKKSINKSNRLIKFLIFMLILFLIGAGVFAYYYIIRR